MARQLRKPAGTAGIRTGMMMNKANESLYDFTLHCMQLQPDEKILEIGFGNGKLFSKVFDKAEGLQVTGIDYSADMVKAAHEHNREFIESGKLQIRSGSSDRLPFPDDEFDRIFCINVVYFWDNPSSHLREIKRVLKPGGSFYATIRSKESMAMMPFTKFGFSSWTPEEWKIITGEKGLQWRNAFLLQEPEMIYKGESVKLESWCMQVTK
jgi:ubiquinone/menaquinone biosynthesis C-methylase UbiE